jgi:hypothetical protein
VSAPQTSKFGREPADYPPLGGMVQAA